MSWIRYGSGLLCYVAIIEFPAQRHYELKNKPSIIFDITWVWFNLLWYGGNEVSNYMIYRSGAVNRGTKLGMFGLNASITYIWRTYSSLSQYKKSNYNECDCCRWTKCKSRSISKTKYQSLKSYKGFQWRYHYIWYIATIIKLFVVATAIGWLDIV